MKLRAIKTIWLRELRVYYRDKAGRVSSIGRSLLWLLVFGGGFAATRLSGLNINYQTFIFPGIIAMSLLFTSVRSGITVIWDREFGFMKEILVSPASRSSIMAGKVLGTSTIAAGEAMIVLLLGPLVGVSINLSQVLLCLALMFLISFTLVSIGLILSTLMKTFEGFQSVINLFIMPMFFLSGSLFPLSSIPAWMTPAVDINPLTYGVDLLRVVLTSEHFFDLRLDVAVLVFYAIATMALGVRAFNSRE